MAEGWLQVRTAGTTLVEDNEFVGPRFPMFGRAAAQCLHSETDCERSEIGDNAALKAEPKEWRPSCHLFGEYLDPFCLFLVINSRSVTAPQRTAPNRGPGCSAAKGRMVGAQWTVKEAVLRLTVAFCLPKSLVHRAQDSRHCNRASQFGKLALRVELAKKTGGSCFERPVFNPYFLVGNSPPGAVRHAPGHAFCTFQSRVDCPW